MGYDPIKLSENIGEKVFRDNQRKYYRFRKAKFYGGIATADCVGCNLSCHFCWSKKPRKQPTKIGDFHSPEEVKEKLVNIAEKYGFHQIRLSGNEPTIGKEHLLSLLEKLEEPGLKFILETNGILLGHDASYAEELASSRNIHVRVSLKGCNAEQFSKLTGANPKGFKLQIQSLENLVSSGVECHAAVLKDFTDAEKLNYLRKSLREVDPLIARDIEFEKLMLYPHVRKQLNKAGIEIPDT